jgi:3-dehydroquinate synthase
VQQAHSSSRPPLRRTLELAAAAAPAAAVSATEEMRTVQVDLGDRSYPIYIGQNLLQDGARLRQHIPGNRVLIVTNTTIAPLYLQK